MGVDLDIDFRAKLDAFRRELETVPNVTKKAAREATKAWVDEYRAQQQAARETAKEQRRLEREAEKAAERLNDVNDQAGRVAKIGSLLGGSVGGPIGDIADLTESWHEGLGKVGMKMLALGAGVAVLAGVASAVGGVLTNVEAYSAAVDSLARRDLITPTQIGQLHATTAGWAELSNQVSGIAVRVATAVAPAFENFLVGTAYGLEYVVKLASSWSFEEAGASARLAAREVWSSMRTSSQAVTQADERAGLLALGMLDAGDAAVDTGEKTTKAARISTAAIERQSSAEAELTRYTEWRGQVEASIAEQEAKAQARALQFQRRVAENLDRIGKAGNNAAEAYAAVNGAIDAATGKTKRASDEVARFTEDRQQATFDTISTATEGLVRSIVTLADTAAERQIAAAGRSEAEHRRILRRQFAAQKAAAISLAVINTAVGVSKTLSEYAYPTNIILGALTLAAGAAEVATIAAQRPSFHTGGIVQTGAGKAPDEVDARLQAGEGVLTKRGVASLGGEEGVRAANRGTSMGGGDVLAVVALDGRVLSAAWAGHGPRGAGGLAARMDARLAGGMTGRAKPRGR